MKKNILYVFILVLISSAINAQDTITPATATPQKSRAHSISTRINLYGAYAFDDKFSSTYDSYNYYEGKLKGGFQYGAGIEFVLPSNFGIEVLWLGQNTKAPVYYASNSSVENYADFDVNLNYALLGFSRHVKLGAGKVDGYGGLMAGGIFVKATNPDDTNTETDGSQSAGRFAWGLRLGINIFASKHVGIKLSTQLLSAVQSAGGSLYFGSGGSGVGVSTYSTIYQFCLGGGLVYKFGE